MEKIAVNMRGITKRFKGVAANEGVDFTLRCGSIHGLLGENGAGKTTLMNILYGLYQADEGEVSIFNKVEDIASPTKAISLGIGMVHQHFMLAKPLTVVENVMLGKKSRRGILLDSKKTAEELAVLSQQYHMNIDPWAKICQLSVGEQQRVEILTALYMGAEILILDEPTAVLTPQEAEQFFHILRQLRDGGKSIILITHKLEEIISIVDEVTVLRDGKSVGKKVLDKTTTKEELTRMMVGRDVLFAFEKSTKKPGDPVYKICNIEANNDKGLAMLKQFSLELREGEVLSGMRKATSGHIFLGDEDLTNKTPLCYINHGISHIPEDRHSTGLALNWSLKMNLILKQFGKPPFMKYGLVNTKKVDEHFKIAQEAYQIKCKNPEEHARALSGGNQQKIILAREMDGKPKVLLANQPTRGLDIGAAEYVRQKILDGKNQGTAVLLISADLEEILQISDRIAVIYAGEIMGILDRGADIYEIGELMMGKKMEVCVNE